MDHDSLIDMPANISTIVDLLDTKDISWGEYQEHLPYAGFQGFNYSNQATLRDDYAYRHNPIINFRSVTNNETRARRIKSFTDFQDDLGNKLLPQWAFIKPNVTNDAHDTNIAFGAKWERIWMSNLFKDPYFMNNTLVLLTFDEDAYLENNRVFSVLVGCAVPDHLKGTKDGTFYTHYSSIATVSANWGLPSLGRWDCGANIFEIVFNKTGYVNYEVDITHLLLNQTYPGPSAIGWIRQYSPVWPIPTTDAQCSAGQGVLDSVKSLYGSLSPTYNYTSPYPVDASSYNMNVTGVRTSNTTTGASMAAVSAGTAVTAPGFVIITLAFGGYLFCLV